MITLTVFQYGNIIVLIISPKKKGSALVEFETVHSAVCMPNIYYI